MERTAFTLLHDMEDSWWYRGRLRAVIAMTTRAALPKAGPVLDFGAGYGGMENLLATLGTSVYAFEPDAEARVMAARRAYIAIYATEAEALSRTYDRIGLFDVVEHIEDDAMFLKRAYGALNSGGALLITAPAFPFLWSVHDEAHHHYRRYTKASLTRALEASGYQVQALSYWNALLFIPAACVRLLGRSGEGSFASSFLNKLFLAVVVTEARILRYVGLPFGTGIVAIARKL